MRLKAIKLAGFKSFVDPTTVPFATNMTAIVGPNGCGKSNTIDAVRWVMGESSAKYLRGDAMTDVIFNGSSERKPVGKASVELIFDNTDKTLVGQYAAYNEISLKRQVSRDGQSLYFLNGTKCRRKDITDIFLGTGLGPRSYAIIEQGMISRLIEAKPDELRVYVEEAAGISRYKERRRETENRMRHTQENLERLSDIRQELGRQIAHLQRQAAAAERYQALKLQEREKKSQLHALRWLELDAEYRARELDIATQQTRFEAQMAEQRAIDAEMEAQRQEQYEKNEQYNLAQAKSYEIGTQIARQEQKIEHQSQMSLQLDRELGEVEKGLFDTERAQEQDQLALEEVSIELDMLLPELEMLRAEQEEAQIRLLGAEAAQQQWQEQWDAFSLRASEPAKQAEVAQTKLQNSEQQLARLQQQHSKVQAELNELTNNPELAEIELLQEQLAEQELAAEEHLELFEEQQAQLLEQREFLEQQRTKITDGKQQLNQLQSRKATLEALQKAAQNQGSEAISHWLESHQLARKPRLIDSLHVESGWEIAVETVLGNYLQAVMIDNLDPAQHWLAGLKEGQLALWQSAATPSPNSTANTLASKVTSQQDIYGLLNGVKVADNLAQALTQRVQLQAHESIITQDGVWLGKHWLRVSKAANGEGGILARAQELEVLDAQIDDLDIDIEEWEVDFDALKLRLDSLEQQRDNDQREQQQLTHKLMQLKSQLSGKQARAEQFALREQRLIQERQEISDQQELERENIEELRLVWQEAVANIDTDINEREQLQQQRQQTQQDLEQARYQARNQQERSHQIELKVQGFKNKEQSLQQALARLNAQLAHFKERKSQIEANQKLDHSDDLLELKAQLEEMLARHVDAENTMRQARTALDIATSRVRELEMKRAETENNALAVRNQLEQVKMECQALDIRRQGLIEQLQEQQLTLKEVLDNLPEQADAALWQQQLEEIATAIQRLGAVNLTAIDEYKIQSERQVYLDAQNDDLEKALATLESAIAKIDRETRTRFKETFDKINSGLAELFPKVFGGGHACLELTEEDMLTTGVAIMARPPGKKNSTIHLLSGGEKALTAIALVFSIFQLNPAPFCMLDEVDAPLDDANVGRYARLVKAMSEKVQFIYITHNKIAMEMADQLMGVTMQEPGVSRLVSVDIETAVEMVE